MESLFWRLSLYERGDRARNGLDFDVELELAKDLARSRAKFLSNLTPAVVDEELLLGGLPCVVFGTDSSSRKCTNWETMDSFGESEFERRDEMDDCLEWRPGFCSPILTNSS